jgi:probable rRNA maturation factor
MIEINNTTKYKIDEKSIKKVAAEFLRRRRLSRKDVSIAFIGDKEMRRLNRRYRKKDKTTDVLSFAEEGEDAGFFGEIVISPAQIKKQARENGNTFKQELIFILVHGLLHLAGYDDCIEKDRINMIKLGEKFIKESRFKI